MLKNENTNIKNNKNKIPLIERIVICGISKKELQNIQIPSNNEELLIESISNLNLEILEEYKSSFLKEDTTNNNKNKTSYVFNIQKYSIPFGISPKIIKSKNSKIELDKKIISFSLVENTKLKHCSSLSFYDNYKYGSKDLIIKKSITLISSKDYYSTHKKILENIFKIISNFYLYKNKNINLLKKIRYENYFSKNISLIPEYYLLNFYFSFLLNSFDINPINNKLLKSFFILPFKSEIQSALYDDFFFKIYLDDKTPFPIKDYDLSILFEKFHIDDLIILYQSILMEYEIILIFENFEEINILIYSLLSIIYPLKWKFPITSFLLPETEVMLDAPFATIIGVHESFKYLIEFKIKKECFNNETTIIYDLKEKKFILKDPKFPFMNNKLLNIIKCDLYFLKSEILQFKNKTIKCNNSLMKLFEGNEKLVNKIDTKIYINMKIISIFFNVFFFFLKNFKTCIKYESINKININACEPNEFFDFNNFENDSYNNNNKNLFFLNFSKTLMFSYFLRSFIKYSTTKKIYILINEILAKLGEKDTLNPQKNLNALYAKNIRNNLSNYYLIKYISLNTLLNYYFIKLPLKSDFNDIYYSNIIKSNEIWNTLDISKIKNFPENILNTYYSNLFHTSKFGESFIDSIMLIGINSNILSNKNNTNINDIINKKIKDNDEIFNIIKDYIENNTNNKNNIISIRNTAHSYHHRSNSSMNEKIDINYNLNLINPYPFKLYDNSPNNIISVNTFVPNNTNFMQNNNNIKNDYYKKISNEKQKNRKPLRSNYNSLNNVASGVMPKHAGDKDDIINIPDDI